MTNTSPLRRIAATVTLVLAAVISLAGCGGTAYADTAPVVWCAGPEQPDDLEDLFDRDTVRWPDEACASGSLQQGFSLVSAPDWSSVPDIGEEVDRDDSWGFHRTHRVGHSPRVIFVEKPAARPKTYLLVTRTPTVGSVQVRESASVAAKQARKTTPPAAVSSVKDERPSTVQRGGLGSKTAVVGNVDRADRAQAASRAASAGKAAAASRASTSSSSKSSFSSSSSSSSSRKSK